MAYGLPFYTYVLSKLEVFAIGIELVKKYKTKTKSKLEKPLAGNDEI